MELKEKLPRLEAWDAEKKDDGWAIDISDLNKWAKDNLEVCVGFNSDIETAKYIIEVLKELIEYTE